MSNITLLAVFLVAWLLVGCATETKTSTSVATENKTETNATVEDYKITKERYFNVNL